MKNIFFEILTFSLLMMFLYGCKDNKSSTNPENDFTNLTEPYQLTSFNDNKTRSDISWSPNGNEIAFCYGDTLFSISINSKNIRIIHTDSAQHHSSFSDPTWDPNGIKIIVTRFEQTGPSSVAYDLWAYPLNGGIPERITNCSPSSAYNPQWSHNGDYIAYQRGGGLRIRNMNTGNEIDIADADHRGVSALCWSPNDQMLAFAVDFRKIYTIQATGGSATLIVSDAYYLTDLEWLSENNKIIFYSTDLTNHNMTCWNVPSSGGSPAESTIEFNYQYPFGAKYSPDGKTMAAWKGKEIWLLPAEEF